MTCAYMACSYVCTSQCTHTRIHIHAHTLTSHRCHADGLRDREMLVTREDLEYEAVDKRDDEGRAFDAV